MMSWLPVWNVGKDCARNAMTSCSFKMELVRKTVMLGHMVIKIPLSVKRVLMAVLTVTRL